MLSEIITTIDHNFTAFIMLFGLFWILFEFPIAVILTLLIASLYV